jgi:hypothetical protein
MSHLDLLNKNEKLTKLVRANEWYRWLSLDTYDLWIWIMLEANPWIYFLLTS